MYVNGGKKPHESTYFTRNKVVNIIPKVIINVPGCAGPGSIGSDTWMVGPRTHGHITNITTPPIAYTKDTL